jgi:hypothetical protein
MLVSTVAVSTLGVNASLNNSDIAQQGYTSICTTALALVVPMHNLTVSK